MSDPVTANIPDEQVQAFTEAYLRVRKQREQLTAVPERIAAGLAAVRPLIQAQERARIAAALRLEAAAGRENAVISAVVESIAYDIEAGAL